MSRSAGVDALAQQLLAGQAGVHRDDAVAFALQVLHHEIAGAVPVRRGTDQGDGAHRRQDAAQLGVRVGDRLDRGHGWRPWVHGVVVPHGRRVCLAGGPASTPGRGSVVGQSEWLRRVESGLSSQHARPAAYARSLCVRSIDAVVGFRMKPSRSCNNGLPKPRSAAAESSVPCVTFAGSCNLVRYSFTTLILS